MTIIVDQRDDAPCPQSVNNQYRDVIIVRSRIAEMKLMDGADSTCLPMFVGDRRFPRFVAYVYVPIPVDTLRVVLKISGTKCTDPGIAVYHQYGVGDMNMECIIMETSGVGAIDRCEFLCTNICPIKSVVEIYIQSQKTPRGNNASASLCEIRLTN